MTRSNRSRSSSRRYAKGQSRQGAATVEFAVVAPLLLIIVLGMVDAGQMANVGQVVSCATALGAREAAKATTDTTASVETAIIGYIADRFPNLSSEALAAALTINVLDSTGTPLLSDQLGLVPMGSSITVGVVFQYDAVRWLDGSKVAQGKTLEATAMVRRE